MNDFLGDNANRYRLASRLILRVVIIKGVGGIDNQYHLGPFTDRYITRAILGCFKVTLSL